MEASRILLQGPLTQEFSLDFTSAGIIQQRLTGYGIVKILC